MLAINPLEMIMIDSYFDKEVLINLLLYLWRYLFPRVSTPTIRLARPIAIPEYASISPIELDSFRRNIIAAVGADTLTSFDP